MFSFMMVRNEIIKWQWNNIFQSKSRFAPFWWRPRSSSATSVQSRFTLLLYKPQFFSRSKIEISIEIPHGQHFGGALYFLHTQNHILCCCLFSTYFQNDVPLDTRTAPGGPQGKVGPISKQFHHKFENMLQTNMLSVEWHSKIAKSLLMFSPSCRFDY